MFVLRGDEPATRNAQRVWYGDLTNSAIRALDFTHLFIFVIQLVFVVVFDIALYTEGLVLRSSKNMQMTRDCNVFLLCSVLQIS